MNNTIYLDTMNPVLEKELTARLGDFQIKDFSLKRDGSRILSCPSPCLWMVEISTPDLESLLFIKNLIEERNEPVLVLSREKSDPLRMEVYHMGADDYVEAPWFPAVIALRVKAVLRRRGLDSKEKSEVRWFYEGSRFQLDGKKRDLHIDERNVSLTPSQWNLLNTLIRNGNRAVSREYLLSECLSQENRKTRTLDNHMKNLRRNIGTNEMIETVRGYGYRLKGKAC